MGAIGQPRQTTSLCDHLPQILYVWVYTDMCQGNRYCCGTGWRRHATYNQNIMLNFNIILLCWVTCIPQPKRHLVPPNTVLSRSLRKLSQGANLENTLGEEEESLGRFYWACIFERLWSSGIDSKEWIPPTYVAWRAGTIPLFLLGS